MKTPHRITLIRGDVTPRFNPVTGEYEAKTGESVTVPCFVNEATDKKVFEEYGNRSEVVIIVRFMHTQEPFQKAVFNGGTYAPIEKIIAPIKGSVRLKKVVQ